MKPSRSDRNLQNDHQHEREIRSEEELEYGYSSYSGRRCHVVQALPSPQVLLVAPSKEAVDYDSAR